MITEVRMTKSAKKDLNAAPENIQRKFVTWTMNVAATGVEDVRKISGWHDEPLKGNLAGIRSIRLSALWRAFYIEKDDGSIKFIEVKEINPHKY